MKIANYLCAHLFHSSKAALRLTMTDTKYLPMAEDIISIKNQHAHKRLMKEGGSANKYFRLNYKIMKYESFLEKKIHILLTVVMPEMKRSLLSIKSQGRR